MAEIANAGMLGRRRCRPDEGRKLMASFSADGLEDEGNELEDLSELRSRSQRAAETATIWSETASRSLITRSAVSCRDDSEGMVMAK